jgi:hypothetical protein
MKPGTANIALNVATTGDNITGDGTLAAPFATIQHELDVASEYDYQSKYYVTINIANGTYVSIGYGSNWYDGGIFLIGDTASPNGTAPLVVINGGGGVCLTNKNTGVAINIDGITFKAVGEYSEGIWNNWDIFFGHIGWDVQGYSFLHCGGSLLTFNNRDMEIVTPTLRVWGFNQAFLDFTSVNFNFPAGGCAIGWAFLYVGSYTNWYLITQVNGNLVTGRRIDIDAGALLILRMERLPWCQETAIRQI